MITICANNLENILTSNTDLSLQGERFQVVIIEERCRSMIFVGEIDHGLSLVYFLEIRVEVLTGSGGECCSELPNSDRIGGIERISQDSISSKTQNITCSIRNHPTTN